jgi:hypothetical protein
MSFKVWTSFGAVVLLSASTLTGCGVAGDVGEAIWESVDGSSDQLDAATTRSGEQMCLDAVNVLVQKRHFSECDLALVTDCMAIVGLLQDSYVDAVAQCLAEDETPAECFFEATLDLKPTAAHHDLVSSYCDQCLFGLDGCEDAFYFDGAEQLGLGMVALPFNEDVVRQIENECTTDLTCSIDLPACAEEIVLERLIPEKTLLCLLNPLD